MVLCHGYGAPGTDLVPLAFEIFDAHEELKDSVQFVFPAAPLSLEEMGMFGGRAWWPLNVAAMMEAVASGDIQALRDAFPPGLPEAREQLLAVIAELQQQTALPLSRFVLGGFSQGAMLALDVALHLPESPAAQAVFSGMLLSESLWSRLAPARRGMPVLQTHGRYDSILPFQAAVWLRDLLQEAGLQVEFQEFAGDHTIPMPGLRRFSEMLAGLVAG